MLWKKLAHNGYKYVAVLEIDDVTDNRHLYGQRTFAFRLADGTTEKMTFEPEVWQTWQEAITKGGCVVNP